MRLLAQLFHDEHAVSAYGIKSDGNGAAGLGSLGLTSVVNDRLVVLV